MYITGECALFLRACSLRTAGCLHGNGGVLNIKHSVRCCTRVDTKVWFGRSCGVSVESSWCQRCVVCRAVVQDGHIMLNFNTLNLLTKVMYLTSESL